MRFAKSALFVIPLLIVTAAAPVRAEPPVAYVEAPRTTDDPLRSAIETRLDALEGSTRAGPQRAWVEALATLYEARDYRPIWLTGRGVPTAALQAAAEIARAGEWGLDTSQLPLPDLGALGADPAQLAEAEVRLSLTTMTYIAHARGHRVDPSQLSKWLDQRPKPVDVLMVAEVADAEEPAATLRRHHPRHPQFEKLRQAYLKQRAGAATAGTPAPPIQLPPSGPRLKIGSEHADVAILRRRLQVAATDGGDAQLYDKPLADAVRQFQRKAGLKATGTLSDTVRAALNAEGRGETLRRGGPSETNRLLVNMERWRWLPYDLGTVHIWNNLPEFETRVVKQGRVVHQERIIIGKTETQTPVFSDRIRFVVFQPEWGIPNSIKITDLLPKLRGGDSSVLDRRGLRVATASGRLVSGSSIDWSRVDIREVAIVQPSGASNPLGQVKFMFPNKHDVYMHDTPTKHLFNSSVRTYSHGCIRVRNPRALAELVFAEDRGWGQSQIGSLLGGGKSNNRVDLERAIDVHNTYFTVVAGEDGSLRTLADIYGHDRRIAAALAGTPASVIARDDPAVRHEQMVRARQQQTVAATRQRAEQRQEARAQPDNRRPAPRLQTRQWAPFYGLGYN